MSYLSVERQHLLQDVPEAAVIWTRVHSCSWQEVGRVLEERRLRADGELRHAALETDSAVSGLSSFTFFGVR